VVAVAARGEALAVAAGGGARGRAGGLPRQGRCAGPGWPGQAPSSSCSSSGAFGSRRPCKAPREAVQSTGARLGHSQLEAARVLAVALLAAVVLAGPLLRLLAPAGRGQGSGGLERGGGRGLDQDARMQGPGRRGAGPGQGGPPAAAAAGEPLTQRRSPSCPCGRRRPGSTARRAGRTREAARRGWCRPMRGCPRSGAPAAGAAGPDPAAETCEEGFGGEVSGEGRIAQGGAPLGRDSCERANTNMGTGGRQASRRGGVRGRSGDRGRPRQRRGAPDRRREPRAAAHIAARRCPPFDRWRRPRLAGRRLDPKVPSHGRAAAPGPSSGPPPGAAAGQPERLAAARSGGRPAVACRSSGWGGPGAGAPSCQG
jgi:hypothetical protein